MLKFEEHCPRGMLLKITRYTKILGDLVKMHIYSINVARNISNVFLDDANAADLGTTL